MREIITEKFARSMTSKDLVSWRKGYNFNKIIVDVVSSNGKKRVNLVNYLRNL